MTIKSVVTTLFNDNTNYTTPDQATNQASSIDALSKDLYTDSKRFIYELLQNADDSSEAGDQVKVWIKAFDDVLVVAHSGKAFDERDVQGLCNINNGTKKADATKTGYKGIGFKSVFGQSEEVTVYTDNEYFRFDSSFPFEWKWIEKKEIWESRNERRFVHPWQIIPVYTELKDVVVPIHQYLQSIHATVATIIKLNNAPDTFSAIKELSENVNMFLFLKNVSEINFEIGTTSSIEINRSWNGEIALKRNGRSAARWLINTRLLSVPIELSQALVEAGNMPEKLLTAKSVELTLAAKFDDDGIVDLSGNEKLLYSYLPTEEAKYQFPVLVNTSFLTNANREHLHTDSKWNQWLFNSIAIEIFKWISVLIVGKLQLQAYRLIPRDVYNDELGRYFNAGIKEAIATVEFVFTKDNRLVKIDDCIVDFTYLSDVEFVGEEAIKKLLGDFDRIGLGSSKAFVREPAVSGVIKSLGADSFEWKDLPRLLTSPSFAKAHSIEKNIKLIKHFKFLVEKKSVTAITNEVLGQWPFIIDHKGKLNIPTEIYFPTSDDKNWNDPRSDLAFLHIELQKWLSLNPDVRIWLEQLGVVEKTDISFINKTLIPNQENYITQGNAVQTIRDIFNLYAKGELNSDLLRQLSGLKLLTKNGRLLAAKDCILSMDYSSNIELEDVLDEDVFVSVAYMDGTSDKDEWKRFFRLLTVAEGFVLNCIESRYDKTELIAKGFSSGYFGAEDKKFSPYVSTFTGNAYKDFVSLTYLHKTIDNYPFAKLFWKDVLNRFTPLDLSVQTTVFWGKQEMSGQINGDKVENYIRWSVKHLNVIPVASKECKTSGSVLLNTEEIKRLAGEYLPVFDGVELSPDWRAFFTFRTDLKLEDYLHLLTEISLDINEEHEVKKFNVDRIQLIYKRLMDLCANWGGAELATVLEWSSSALLLNTKKQFSSCESIKHYIDGNDSIFQDHFKFLELNAENKQHPNIVEFLNAFQVGILKQDDFNFSAENVSVATSLLSHLAITLPFLQTWIESERGDDKTKEAATKLVTKFTELTIYEAETLRITYEEIGFSKHVNVHFDNNNLYLSKPWYSSKVLLQLASMLCRYFDVIGHDKKLNFLINTNIVEIKEYFDQESIATPHNFELATVATLNATNVRQKESSIIPVKSFDEIKKAIDSGTSLDFYHIPTSDYDRFLYVERLISRAVANVTKYLSNLPEYNCESRFEIAPSIIGGITKNGRDLTVVARPSDNGAVLLYYTSEFDVLEYVDAEFWCEDGESLPQKITMGHLLKVSQINRIPVTKFKYERKDFEQLIVKQKAIDFEFEAVPSSPYKLAQIISSFSNTEGGTLIYGINKNGAENQLVGLSTDFRMDDITNKALLMISPLPAVTYDWVNAQEKYVFIIKVEKSSEEMLVDGKKYIREASQTISQDDLPDGSAEVLAIADFDKTVAIIIGIEDYKPRGSHQVPPVLYAKKDALLFKKMLIAQFNVEEENIYTYINEDALKSDLEYGLNGLFHSLSDKDRLIFYYVGHGFHNGTTNYLSTYDTHISNVAETAVSLRKILLDPLSMSKCRSGLVFIDACAQSIKHEQERALITDLNSEEFRLIKSDQRHLATFLSCQPGQSSYSCHDLGHGVWTYYLVKALSGSEIKAVKSGKYITDRSLNDYLAKSVTDYANNKLLFTQNPKGVLDSNCENVIITI